MDSVESFASFYSTAYYVVLLGISIYAVIAYQKDDSFLNKGMAWPLALAIILFLAFRPLTYKYGFGDTQGYAFFFKLKSLENEINPEANDLGYEYLTFYLRHFDVSVLFMVMGALYVIPQVLTSKILTPSHYGILFLIIVLSFSYWGYGVNGMRNGVALSLVMLGMVKRNLVWTPILFLLGLSFHTSALLPIAAYGLNYVYNKPKAYVIGWGICLLLSIFVSNFLTEVLPLQDIIKDDRVNYLSTKFDSSNSADFSSTGFRWDFVLYSAVPIVLGYYYILSNPVCDRIYVFLFNTYCTCNAFWLFTMYVPYNNRFAYLSWFLYPLLTAYPFLCKEYDGEDEMTDSDVNNIKLVIGLTYLFTFIMWLK